MEIELIDMKIELAKQKQDYKKVKELNKERKEIFQEEERKKHNRGIENMTDYYREKSKGSSGEVASIYDAWANETDDYLRY